VDISVGRQRDKEMKTGGKFLVPFQENAHPLSKDILPDNYPI